MRFKKDSRRTAEAQSLVKADAAVEFGQQLMLLRGMGGSDAERRQFADQAMEIVHVSQRIAAASHTKSERA